MNYSQKLQEMYNNKSCLPAIELDRNTIQNTRKHIRPLPNSSLSLSITPWSLAHAIKKSDYTRIPPENLLSEANGFLLEHFNLFDWNTKNLRLNSGMSDCYADFSRTSLAGRVAQGMTLLFMENQGYIYSGRVQNITRHPAVGGASNVPNQKQLKMPDFIFENGSNEKALAEAKGGFVPFGGTPSIKGDLKKALLQLNSGASLTNLQFEKSFAVGTYLREVEDSSKETSLIAFTDPPPDKPQDSLEFPQDIIRRTNYASWLSIMGYEDASRRLWIGAGEPDKRSILTIDFGRHRYAVTIVSIASIY